MLYSIAYCSQKRNILRIALALGAIKTMSSAYAMAPLTNPRWRRPPSIILEKCQ